MRGKVARFSGLLVLPAPRTLYFNGVTNTDWYTLSNWWNDASHTDQAASLPKFVDSVVVTGTSINTSSGPRPVVVDFTYDNPTFGSHRLDTPLEVSGVATLNKDFVMGGSLIGNAVVNDFAGLGGTVLGDVTFNNTSFNGAAITGNSTFNDSAQNVGEITGDATFNGSSKNFGNVSGTAKFNDSSCNSGTAGTFDPDPPPAC